MTLLQRVSAHLADHRIDHAVIGASALAAAGIARSTYDIDLLACDTRVLAPAFWEAIAAAGASVDCRRGDHDDPLAGVVRIEQPGQRPVDVVVGKHAWQARILHRARSTASGPPVVGPADLILLKLYAGGTQDLWDVRELLTLPDAPAIAALVEEALESLPAAMRRAWQSLR